MTLEFFSLEMIQNIAQKYGYIAVFIGILLENAGLPIPGETITLAGGFLAGSGELRYGFVLASAAAGAIVGDNLGYLVGRLGGWSLMLRISQFFRIPEARLLLVKDQFSQNAAKAVILGRFVALLRIFAGPLAGLVQMPYPRFLLCNLVGAVAWAGVMVTLAYTVGQFVSLGQLVAWVGQFALLALGLLVVAIVLPIWLESRQTRLSTDD